MSGWPQGFRALISDYLLHFRISKFQSISLLTGDTVDTWGHRKHGGHGEHSGTTFATVQIPVHTATKVAETYPICDARLSRSKRRKLRFVTEIAPKSPFLCVNRRPFWYGSRVDSGGLELFVA